MLQRFNLDSELPQSLRERMERIKQRKEQSRQTARYEVSDA